jgi:epoxyqueuosine reductase
VANASGSNAMVSDWVTSFVASSQTNSLFDGTNSPAWDTPLVGFARGDDPLFTFLHEDIGDFYWTPAEAFRAAFGDPAVDAADLSIICWVLPQTQRAIRDNAQATAGPSESWARSRHHGEVCNDALRKHVVAQFAAIGIQAVAPVLAPGWGWRKSVKYGQASNWSERHAAYIAGLGTFGLSDGLITRAGKAHRCGSIVARLPLEPTPRPYTDIHAYCLHYNGGRCQACITRCPAGAITPAGHDKLRCEAFTTGPAAVLSRDRYGIPTTPCGLCQVGVPCASCIPQR